MAFASAFLRVEIEISSMVWKACNAGMHTVSVN